MSVWGGGSAIVRTKYSMVFGLLVSLLTSYCSPIVCRKITDRFVLPQERLIKKFFFGGGLSVTEIFQRVNCSYD